jgi:hypothetical protein
MTTRSNNDNSVYSTFLKLKKNIAGITEDIKFLKLCLEHSVIPVSHKVVFKSSIEKNPKFKLKIEKDLIKRSIQKLYSKLDQNTLLTYNTHLKFAKESENDLYLNLAKINRAFDCEKDRKRKTLAKKLKNLIKKQGRPNSEPNSSRLENIPNFVVNKSSVNFGTAEMNLLNKGLNYAIHPYNIQKEEIVIDVEASARFLPIEKKEEIRRATITEGTNPIFKDEEKILKSLSEKPVYYLKADKGNSIVIMDKTDYDNKFFEILSNSAN